MPIERKHLIAATLLSLGACTQGMAGPGTEDRTWGEANRQTMAAQIIDPVPPAADTVQTGRGDHTQMALDRYRTDRVKRPDRLRVTSVGTGIGTGGQGNAGTSGPTN